MQKSYSIGRGELEEALEYLDAVGETVTCLAEDGDGAWRIITTSKAKRPTGDVETR